MSERRLVVARLRASVKNAKSTHVDVLGESEEGLRILQEEANLEDSFRSAQIQLELRGRTADLGRSYSARLAYRPVSGDLKSGMPADVDSPAPVAKTILRASIDEHR